MNRIRRNDLDNLEIVDAIELASDGYYVYLTTTLSSTNSTGNVITINLASDGQGIENTYDHPAKSGDRVRLTGTSGALADGYYTINSVLSNITFSVLENIANSTGGSASFIYAEGAKQIGFSPINVQVTNATNVQDAIVDIYNSHPTLRQLIHLANNGPFEGFASGSYKEILPSGDPFPTSIVWWTSSGKIKKIIEKNITYNLNKTPNTIQWKVYDTNGSTVLSTVTDTISYVGVIETSRSRAII